AVAAALALAIAALGAGCGGRSHDPGMSGDAAERLSAELVTDVPSWVEAEKLPVAAAPGAKLFAVVGCTACHTYLDSGSSNLGAPDLSAIGTRNLGVGYQVRHLECPAC